MAASQVETDLMLPDLEDEESAGFWLGAAEGELRVQTCSACNRRRMPPRPMCPHCRSIDYTWEATSGRGRIWSFVVPHPPLLPAYAELSPYNVIVVELDEEPTIRFVGNLLASQDGPINEIDPATITIGEPVKVVFQQVGDVTIPRWIRA